MRISDWSSDVCSSDLVQAWDLQDPHRREPEQDDDHSEPPRQLVLVAEEQGPERAGPQTEEREDGREAAYEEQRGTPSGGTRFSLAEVGYGDGGDVGRAAGHGEVGRATSREGRR